jgi:hypothetical protein
MGYPGPPPRARWMPFHGGAGPGKAATACRPNCIFKASLNSWQSAEKSVLVTI